MNPPCQSLNRRFVNVLATITAIMLVTIISCSGPHTQDTPEDNLPKALKDKNSSYDVVSKRGYDDLLESLYSELQEKMPELKQLENRIAALRESKSDSTASFNTFNTKNQAYFGSANGHIEQIKDSVLRSRMQLLIANSLLRYNTSTAHHNAIIHYIETNEVTLNDLHTILKITRTLPIIEQFQKDNLPSAKPLDGFANELTKTALLADTLSKK